MAALDFPGSPTHGTTFTGSNGVTYTFISPPGSWMASGTAPPIVIVSATPPAAPLPGQHWFNSELGALFIWYDDGNSVQWVPASPSVSAAAPGGDFFTAIASSGLTGTPQTLLFPAAMTGNSGNWYNPTNGRYTPPAGRYFIFATIGAGLTTGATQIVVTLRKNGVGVIGASQVPGTANWQGDPSVSAILNANGADWFDIQGSCNNGGNMSSWMWFGAFPLTGIKGPVGDPGGTVASKLITFTRDPAAASGNVSYTGVGFRPSSILFCGGQGNQPNIGYFGMVDANRTGFAMFDASAGVASPINAAFACGVLAAYQSAQIASYDADGFTLAWTKNGSPGGVAYSCAALCFR